MPPRCGGCLAWSDTPLCLRCRAALEPDLDGTAIPALDASLAAVAYAGPVSDWMQRFKYPRPGLTRLDPAPIGILLDLIGEAARDAPGPSPDLVVPVPLHPRRIRARGFNPAASLARRVARVAGCRTAPRALRRTRDTPSQTGLDRLGRRRNVAGAFVCNLRPPGTVWLVDDVVTTGATLSECARELRRNGARRVVAVCVARTPRGHDAPEETPVRRPRDPSEP